MDETTHTEFCFFRGQFPYFERETKVLILCDFFLLCVCCEMWYPLGLALLVLGSCIAADVSDRTVQDCRKYNDDWRVAQCASGLKQAGLITKTLFNGLLDYAKTLGNVNVVTYNSVGFSTGDGFKLVMGVQHNPSFVYRASVRVDPRHYYADRAWYEMERETSKPVMALAQNRVDGLPELDTGMLPMMVAVGNAVTLRVYRVTHNGRAEDACANFASWEYLNSARALKGVMMVVDEALWCPEAANGPFHVIRTEFHVESSEGSDYEMLLFSTWRTSKDDHLVLGTAPAGTDF